MLTTGINVQVRVQPTTQPVFRQHTLHGMLDDPLWMLFQQQTGRRKPLTAGITRVARVYFVGHLGTRQANLIGVDDDYVVPAIDVGRKVGFVFAANETRYLAGEPAKYFALCVNHNPLFLRRFFVGRDGFVTERIHCYGD
jgi:hypothetical protein